MDKPSQMTSADLKKAPPMLRNCSRTSLLSTVLILSFSSPLFAHGTKNHSQPVTKASAAEDAEQMAWGIAGSADKVDRTIDISMLDKMRFDPSELRMKVGETIRFVVRNDGKVMHEFVLGTQETNDVHAALMVKFPGMEHDAPYMAHVEPGKTGKIIWTFNRPGDFKFACLIAGHYQAGMVGVINVLDN